MLQNRTMPLGCRSCSRVQPAIRTPCTGVTRTAVTARAAEGSSSAAAAAPAVTRSELLKGALFVAAAAALPGPARKAAAEEVVEAAAPAAAGAAATNLSKVGRPAGVEPACIPPCQPPSLLMPAACTCPRHLCTCLTGRTPCTVHSQIPCPSLEHISALARPAGLPAHAVRLPAGGEHLPHL